MLWKDRYNLGVSQIDQQHKELFSRVSNFVETLRSNDSWDKRVEKVNETLSFMKDYVITHFHDEEEYQKSIGYPEYESHKKIHQEMVAYVAHFAAEYEKEGFNEKMVQQFAGKLLAWLINHVAAEDQKIADYASKKGDRHE